MFKSNKIIGIILSTAIVLSFVPNTTSYADTSNIYRFSGANRYATSLSISSNGWKTSQAVIIATGDSFPDALCAAPLSKKKDAPILLTEKQSLSSNIINEILRLQAKEADIVGGTGVVSTYVEQQLKSLGLTVNRYAGANRYETSAKVAEVVGTDKGIVIATGDNFPDALSIAPIAAKEGMPILLSDANNIPSEVQNILKTRTIPKSYLVGGTGVLSNKLKVQLPNPKRLGGSTRYDTNLKIIEEFADSLNFNDLYVATGENFPDALSGSALAAKLNAPILLSDGSISSDTENFLTSLNIHRVNLLGGTGVISDNLASKLKNTAKYSSIISIDNFTDTAFLNQKYSLPFNVLANISDGTTKLVPVVWNTNTVDTSNLGSYTFEGTVEGYNNKVIFTLQVSPVSSSINGNYGNGGQVVANEDSLYYIDQNDYYILNRIKSNFSGRKEIASTHRSPISITSTGNSLYYMDAYNYNTILKTDLDGNNEQIMVAHPSAYYIYGNTIYYSDSYGSGIKKVDLDISNQGTVCSESAVEMLVKDGWIYFINNNDSSNLYKIKIDGSGLLKLTNEGFCSKINVVDDYVYYLSGNKIKKVSVNGGNSTCPINCNVTTLNISRGWIYYSNKDDKNSLYKMKMDGSSNQKLGNFTCDSIYIFGDTIYIPTSSDYGLRKIKIDGTETNQYGQYISLNTPIMDQAQVWPNEAFLNWTSASNVLYYEVYRSSSPYGGYSFISNTSSDSFSDYTVKPGNTYWYRVRTINYQHIESEFSDPVSAIIK